MILFNILSVLFSVVVVVVVALGSAGRLH